MDQPDLVKDYLTKIGTSSQHLLSLINDVLDMSRIESGVVKIEEKEVCIPDILHDLKTIIQGNIQAKQQDLYIDTQDVVHENVITDRLRLNQILLNIVSNAIKFTPVGGLVNIRVSEKPCNRKGFTAFEFRIELLIYFHSLIFQTATPASLAILSSSAHNPYFLFPLSVRVL